MLNAGSHTQYARRNRYRAHVGASGTSLWSKLEKKREGFATYRSSELLRLSSLPALLADWRQGGVESGYVVRGEAAVQLATHIASGGGGSLGAKGAAQRRGEAKGSERRLLLAR